MDANALFIEQADIVTALSNATPSSSTPTRVSLKNYQRCTVIIDVANATTVTGSAITLKQATDIANANADEKAVPFTTVYANLDLSLGDARTATAVVSNTFTTLTTNTKNAQYVIEVDPSEQMDINGGFDCLRVGTGNAVAATLTVTMLLWPAKYGRTTGLSAEVN